MKFKDAKGKPLYVNDVVMVWGGIPLAKIVELDGDTKLATVQYHVQDVLVYSYVSFSDLIKYEIEDLI
jgi:hypothetical protein